jgi:hypothetical protein
MRVTRNEQQLAKGAGMRAVMAIVVLGLGCGTAAAQMTTPPGTTGVPGLGATSPLTTMGSSTPASPVGIPMGSTEINGGGLSPAPVTPFNSTANCFGSAFGTAVTGLTTGTSGTGSSASGTVGIGSATTNSTYDGGGTAGLNAGTPITAGSSLTEGCGAAPPGAFTGSPGTASPLYTPGSPGETANTGGTIPLGATELNSAGVSPIVPVQPPTSSIGTSSSGSSSIGSTSYGGP